MPEQTPADLIRTYLGITDRIKVLEAELIELRASHKDIPNQLKAALPRSVRYESIRLFDADAGCVVSIAQNYRGDIEITVEEPPSLDSLTWPATEPAEDPADASDRYLTEDPSEAFELPAVAEAVATCADDVAF